MDFLNELFGSEMGELKRHQKTEEEIKKFCTAEDFTELKRAVHLLKKGYEIQKISVINHLDRYLLELGANELLLQIIIDSMADWDYKMQIECANSFITPIKNKLIEQKNLQKILKFAVEILVSDESAENEQLIEAWHTVFDVIVTHADLTFAIKTIFPVFMEMPSLKNPLPKRKKGNRLLSSFAKQIGEIGFDKEPAVLKQVLAICHDNNYKIRMDGVLFFKDYLKDQTESILQHPRFKGMYISELIELLNDEESYIRIEALEILTSLLDQLDPADIENEFVKEVLRTIQADDAEEIQARLAEQIGRIVFKLQPFGLHQKHKPEFIQFFKFMVNHQELKMRRHAAFNLPCFNFLYRDSQDELDIDFNEIFLKFSKEDDSQIQKTIAASIHEAFQISIIDEDTQKLRDAFKNVIELNNKETIAVIAENLDVSILRYCNVHAVKTYAPLLGGPKEEPPQEILPLKKLQTMKMGPPQKDPKIPIQKKVTGLNLAHEQQQHQQDEGPLLPFILPENMSEVIYADMMIKLLVFDTNLQNIPGLWRTQIKYLANLSKGIHLFNMPEFQEQFLGSLFEYIKGGNAEIRQVSADCIAKILQYQYNSAMRQELIHAIKVDLAESTNCVLRKTFLFFCKSAVNTFSRSFFKQHFLQSYLALSKDRVAAVRMEFAHSLLKLKPYLESEQSLGNELMSLLTQMHSDSDRDVVEAVETCDYELLQMRKKSKEVEKAQNAADAQRLQQEAALQLREAKEEEERKKRTEDEEETKFDFQTMLMETNKKFRRGKMGPFTLGGRKGFGTLSSKPTAGGTSSLLQVPSKSGASSLLSAGGTGAASGLGGGINGTSSGDKTPSKKKTSGTTSGGSGMKKSDTFSSQTKSISSGTGTVGGGAASGSIGGLNPSQGTQKQTGGSNSLSVPSASDFTKRHSVLVTTSSQQLSGGGLGSGLSSGGAGASKGAASKSNVYGRKSSFMGNE